MPARLIESLATTEPLADLFSDQSVLHAMLDFEAALARAEAGAGLIPKAAAKAITSAARSDEFDLATLSRDILRAGTPGIPLAKALTARVREISDDAARFVHWGATSQDVADTAMILLLKRSQPLLTDDLARLEGALHKLSQQHKGTVMVGRTLMQAAPPVTFGLKAAGWLGAVRRGRKRLEAAFKDTLVLQFGGASGTLASLGEKGMPVSRALAAELDLALPEAPWHTHRDRLAALVCACGVLTGSLGKMARDVSLLMQTEVSEAAEPGGEGRGGSSTMPHKQNPIASALALSSAHRVSGLVSSFLSAMVQEHERGVGGWQAEWSVLAAVIESTGLAAASMAEVAQGLSVNAMRMRNNIESTRGVIFAERAAMVLREKLGREKTQKALKAAARKSAVEKKHFAQVLAGMPEVASRFDRQTLKRLEVPEEYLGSAEAFRKRLHSAERNPTAKKER
jgi:3-carboxy-cis,cis-muconate cycloisomerase